MLGGCGLQYARSPPGATCRCVRGVHSTGPAPMPAPIVAQRSLPRKGGVRVARLCEPVDPLHETDENPVKSRCRQVSRWGLRRKGLVDDNKHLSNGPGSRCSVEVLHRRFAVQGALWGGKLGTGVFLLSVERTERQTPDSQQSFDTIRISTGETRRRCCGGGKRYDQASAAASANSASERGTRPVTASTVSVTRAAWPA